MLAGQAFAQRPHPTQRSLSTFAKHPPAMLIAVMGQTFTQVPQATHKLISTSAVFLSFILTRFWGFEDILQKKNC